MSYRSENWGSMAGRSVCRHLAAPKCVSRANGRHEQAKLIDCLRLQPGEQVLDMGCGTAHRLGSECGGDMVRMGVLAGIGGPDCRDVSVWMSLGVYRAGRP